MSLADGLPAVFADALADLANRSLALDPAAAARLATLEGHRIQFSTDLPEPMGARDLTITVNDGRLRLYPRALPEPNVIVSGRPADLVAWLFGDGVASGPGRDLRIDGDGAVLQELTQAIESFRPDLAGPLGSLLGAETARSALGTAELALATLRSAFEGAGQTVRDSAARTFVSQSEAARLLDELDDLRLRVDRLAARVAAQENIGNAP